MTCSFRDTDFTTPSGPLETDKEVLGIPDKFLRNREFEKRHRHPDIEVIYSSDAMPRKNLEIYYYQTLQAAMDRGCPRIIVEPSILGLRIGQYINLGLYMHVTCIGTGLAAIFLGLTFRHKTYVIYTCSTISCLLLHANNLYYSNFKFSRYQFMENDDVDDFLQQTNPGIQFVTDCPIILIPYSSWKRRVLHHIVGCSAGILMFSLIYRGLPVLLCRCPEGVTPKVHRYEGNLFEFFSVLPIFVCASSASSSASPFNPRSYIHAIQNKVSLATNYVLNSFKVA